MSKSYLLIPLKEELTNFSLFSIENVNESKFDFDSILACLLDIYPAISLRNEGSGNYFSHFTTSPTNYVEVWIYKDKSCLSITDNVDNVIRIAKTLGMYVFDVDGSQKCLNC